MESRAIYHHPKDEFHSLRYDIVADWPDLDAALLKVEELSIGRSTLYEAIKLL